MNSFFRDKQQQNINKTQSIARETEIEIEALNRTDAGMMNNPNVNMY